MLYGEEPHPHGLPHRAIAQACAMGVGTVTLYLRRTAQSGLGWPLPAELDGAALEARLFRRPAPVRDRARVRPDCAYVHRELKRDGVTLQLLWEEYVQLHPSGYRYTQFCEIYRQWAKRLRPSMRQVHRAARRPSSTSPANGRAWSTGARASCGPSSCSSPCSAAWENTRRVRARIESWRNNRHRSSPRLPRAGYFGEVEQRFRGSGTRIPAKWNARRSVATFVGQGTPLGVATGLQDSTRDVVRERGRRCLWSLWAPSAASMHTTGRPAA